MFSSGCDECKPGGHGLSPTTFLFSLFPFLATFLIVSTVAHGKLFPLLSAERGLQSRDIHTKHAPVGPPRPSIKRLAAFVFSTTVALATVLVELILCEISGSINPSARGVALRVTITLLLSLLIIALPALEIQSIISAAGYEYIGNRKGCLRLAWVFQILATTAWLFAFWWSGAKLLRRHPNPSSVRQSLGEACLERVGVIGISFMALLSGFASISSPWQNFVPRPRPVSETDLSRKETGLAATQDMLSAKQSRLRALERKLADRPSESYFQRAVGKIRPNADLNEFKTLELEIKGLQTMALSLSTSHGLLQSRYKQQQRSKTTTGRLCLSVSYGFSLFCLYRVFTIAFSAFRRYVLLSNGPNSGSDPVTTLLALVAKHYDPTLDQAAWSRQISLLLSFLILAASFSSVLQTLSLFSRFFPGLLKTIQANLALVVAQLCATYVISAALMLRGMIPGSVLGEGVKSLGGGEMGWVDSWFEGWFLGGVAITAVGVYVGRKLAGEEWEDEWEDGDANGDVERGKRS